eukprot:2796933-Lingulodinium_polyedra.AAC.1
MQKGSDPPLHPAALAAAPPSQQKHMIGEKLFLALTSMQYKHAAKITGMVLEMDSSELLALLASPDRMKSTADKALSILSNNSGAARDTSTTANDVTNVDNT